MRSKTRLCIFFYGVGVFFILVLVMNQLISKKVAVISGDRNTSLQNEQVNILEKRSSSGRKYQLVHIDHSKDPLAPVVRKSQKTSSLNGGMIVDSGLVYEVSTDVEFLVQ